MQIIEILLIAIGLSFDTFAVSISTGLMVSNIKFIQGCKIAIVLALFQSLLPLIGWISGNQIEKYIQNYDHWVAFGLLSAIGIKMIIDSFKKVEERNFNPFLLSVLFGMAIATSLDALVVGFGLAFVELNIYIAILIIGSVTFLISMVGMLLGKNLNSKFGSKVEIIGGLILIGIGLKILLTDIN